MTATDATPATTLREALAGVCGLLLDLDGVLVLRSAAIPGAVDALARLDAAGFPYAIVTNTSLVSRVTLSAQLATVGLRVDPERMLTAASGAASYVRRNLDGRPVYVMSSPDALGEFEGLRLVGHEEAAVPGASAAAVVVGDAADDFTPRNLLSAFRLLRGGARFLAMHKNRWWLTPDGERLDAGGYVAGLEFATERRALVMGKPSRAFFAEGLRALDEVAGRSLPRGDVAMVGDDVWNDVRGGQRAGLRGVFVRSGKHGDAELARVVTERGGRAPDAVAASIADVVDAVLENADGR